MIEVKGKYNTAKIFTDVVDENSIEQVKLLLDQEFTSGSKIRMMPDIHAGAGCTIGTTMTITDKIVPKLVGVDIGCGMNVTKLDIKEDKIDLEELDRIIRTYIPAGFNIRSDPHKYNMCVDLNELLCQDTINIERAMLSLGTLGGGNHFIEVDKDDDGYLYLVIHSGSRHLGLEVANYYQDWATSSHKYSITQQRSDLIEYLKSNGREKDIETELQKLKCDDIPDQLCYVGGYLFDSYIHDMKIVQEYAMWNRRAIEDTILDRLLITPLERFTTIHNYIDTDNMILRKGAVSAEDGEILLIPINMRDGSLLCRGKGNPDWNYSAPHGAGRLFSRSDARKEFSVSQFEKSMDGIYTTSVSFDTLDECPMAYKSMDDIVNNIGDTVDILKVIKPIYNFKASN